MPVHHPNDVLRAYLLANATYLPQELRQIMAAFQLVHVKRGEALLQPGQTCRHFYLIVKGCLRLYHHTPEGRENTHYFAFDGQGITALASFMAEEPYPGFIEAVEASEVWACSRDAYYQLVDTVPGFATNPRKLVERAYTQVVRRMEHLLTQEASARVEWLA